MLENNVKLKMFQNHLGAIITNSQLSNRPINKVVEESVSAAISEHSDETDEDTLVGYALEMITQ